MISSDDIIKYTGRLIMVSAFKGMLNQNYVNIHVSYNG